MDDLAVATSPPATLQLPPPRGGITSFDSATAILRGTASALAGHALPHPDEPHPILERLLPVGNGLPFPVRQTLYRWAGWWTANNPSALDTVDLEVVCRWAADLYGPGPFPGVALGSANGAAAHLCAALGIPWLPQTWLVSGRRPSLATDDLVGDMEWGRAHVGSLLARNADAVAHQMHDPNQDRLMAARMAYFRMKRRRLGEAYTRLLEVRLTPGAPIVVIECRRLWPVTHVGERHLFQVGGYGGLTPEEYRSADPRIAALTGHDHWETPPVDGHAPEAEWGFEPALLDDVRALATRVGAPVRRLVFDEVEGLTPLVAELYAWWYARHGLPVRGLLVESFMLLEPAWVPRAGLVPWWSAFAVEPSARALEAWLSQGHRFPAAWATAFAHGIRSIGYASPARWASILEAAADRVGLLGVDPDAAPADFAVLVRFHRDLARAAPADRPPPPPLRLQELDDFVSAHGARLGVRWAA